MEKKEAMKILKDFYDKSALFSIRTALDTVIPELKESEDEKVRKHLITLFKDEYGKNSNARFAGIKVKDIIAWLEKQGEQKVFIPKFRIGDIVKSKSQPMLDSRIIINIDKDCYRTKGGGCIGFAWEKDYELIKQKPAEVEPKFKVGDWIIDIQGVAFNRIINSYGESYQIETCCSNFWLPIHITEKNYRLWTIQDAKDGDVLATLDYILIFKKLLPKDGGVSYCHYDFGCSTPHFNFNEDDNWYFGKEAKVYPATKEQRELLFQKMKEAGYQWDAEIKELRKIEKNPAEWSEEDERMYKAVSVALSLKDAKGYLRSWYTTPEEADNWLKSLKERVQPKQEWSEEDEARFKSCINVLQTSDGYDTINVKWLKSLRPQSAWRPSEEQIKAVKLARSFVVDDFDEHPALSEILIELEEQLKKLKE